MRTAQYRQPHRPQIQTDFIIKYMDFAPGLPDRGKNITNFSGTKKPPDQGPGGL
jgi:hypothetical protein